MQTLLAQFISDPLFYIGSFLATFAVFGFLAFLRGFLGGVTHLLKHNGNEWHQAHQRTRTVWGIYIMAVMFALWEVVRLIASVFGRENANVELSLWIVGIFAVWIVWRILKNLFAGGNNH